MAYVFTRDQAACLNRHMLTFHLTFDFTNRDEYFATWLTRDFGFQFPETVGLGTIVLEVRSAITESLYSST